MLTIVVVVILATLYAQVEAHGGGGGGLCPPGFLILPYACFKENRGRYSFLDAIRNALENDFATHGAGFNLMTVGNLRHLANRFRRPNYPPGAGYTLNHQAGPFRLNAFKDVNGIWREHLTGNEVSFSHFPSFDPTLGDAGDTIVWYPNINDEYGSLDVVPSHERHHMLTFKTRNDAMLPCPDYGYGAECSYNGDCVDGQCRCDMNFEGFKCQIETAPAMSQKIAILVGNDDDIVLLDPGTGATCTLTDALPVATLSDASVAFLDGTVVVCGGNDGTSDLDTCYEFDAAAQDFVPISSMDDARSNAGSELLCKEEDWWVVGGGTDNTEILSQDGTWATGPRIPSNTVGNDGLCVVRISDTRTALIGGDDGLTKSNNIILYDFADRTWHQGPNLIYATTDAACGTIKDPYSGHLLVMIVGGNITDSTSAPPVQIWNTVTGTVYKGPPTGEEMVNAEFIELNDDQVAVVGGTYNGTDSDCVFTFDFENGWSSCLAASGANSGSTAVAVPADLFLC